MIKIAILGSTGSIGLTALNVVRQNKKNFNIILLSTNSNINKVFNQAKEFNVKNIIISGKKINHSWKKKFKKNNINIFYNFKNLKKILKKKIDYTLNSISGIDGLEPTINIIKFTRKIAIANKEAIICGWNLINKKLIKNKTKFIPVDSEHFSIFKLLNSEDSQLINKIIITASGGPFLNEKNNFKKIKVKDALKHPNWKMGKKITIDSSTLMNKVFEVIEAKKIFNINLDKIYILINPNSYLHAIIIFKNGTIKMLAHETNMDIPIFNSIYDFPSKNFYKTKDLNIDKINKLSLSKPNIRKFKTLNLLKLIPSKDSLFETVVITVNDELVNMFLSGKIDFRKLLFYLIKIINFKLFKKYCNIRPKSIKQIYKVRNVTKEFVNDYIKTK
jgi:1-deoxy-D-xylulose-5-phosphate reductoisomerase|tara:strand:- start:585 stop:1751 length:1167 start_codon:yes stop_codon:yes gene_type:complete